MSSNPTIKPPAQSPTEGAPTRETLLAILQQSEYDFRYFKTWYTAHQTDGTEIKPKEWTAKLRLIAGLSTFFGAIVPFSTLPLQLQLATWCTQPGEWLTRQITQHLAQHQLQAAQRRGLVVIALAGSYGKTSTKKIAEHVLSGFQPTLATAKSINTPLGIARFIRENLKPEHKYFLIELGEYYRGDIKALCQLIHPDYGIVCPAGRQHLERLGDMPTIAATVLELAEYIAKPDHILVHESLQPFAPKTASTWHWYGESSHCQWRLTSAKVSRAGTEGDLQISPTSPSAPNQHLFTPLFGVHQLVNSLPSLWLTQTLSENLPAAIQRLSSTPYVPHRHEPIFIANNVLILDNGYNSNPDSALHSLDLLASLPASHRIVITPGFVEVGETSEAVHEMFGYQLAQRCDYLGLLQSAGSAAIERGWLAGGGEHAKITFAQSQEEAVAKLQPFIVPNSIILFENNLPEVYN